MSIEPQVEKLDVLEEDDEFEEFDDGTLLISGIVFFFFCFVSSLFCFVSPRNMLLTYSLCARKTYRCSFFLFSRFCVPYFLILISWMARLVLSFCCHTLTHFYFFLWRNLFWFFWCRMGWRGWRRWGCSSLERWLGWRKRGWRLLKAASVWLILFSFFFASYYLLFSIILVISSSSSPRAELTKLGANVAMDTSS